MMGWKDSPPVFASYILVSLLCLYHCLQAAKGYWELTGSVAAPNGAVMRTSVLGIFMYHDMEAVIKNAMNVSKVTHADPRYA